MYAEASLESTSVNRGLLNDQKMVDEMSLSMQLTKTEFEQRISGLPSKQQLVRACFEAVGRKSAR